MFTSFLIEENTNIQKFLEGDNSYIPTSELLYLHNHPLIRPNFLTQVDDLVKKVGDKLIQKNVSGKPISELSNLAIRLGKALENIDANAEDAIKDIRELYQLCLKLDKLF